MSYRVEPRFDEVLDEKQKLESLKEYTSAPGLKENSLTPFRRALELGGIKFLACGDFNHDGAVAKLQGKEADIVAFGRYFVANPDLVDRFKNGWSLNPYDRSTFYGADPPEKGYNDYPFYNHKG